MEVAEYRSCARHGLGYLKMVPTFQQEAKQVIKNLFEDYGLEEFTAHQFLKTYIMGYTNSYLLGLAEYHDVQQLHAVIGKYLLNHADDLNIRYIEDRASKNIFDNLDQISVWRKK